MSPTISTETFKHEELPDASTYIRLLKISSVDHKRDIAVHCELTAWPKASAPVYTAISYTWGDPHQLGIILVNGKRMEVRRNCEDVLRQPCRNKGGYFWIDAICINQGDNHEKSFQVAKMGEVYRDACQTLACVGRHEHDSEFLFERLHKHQRRWKRISNSDNCMGKLRDRPWLTLRRKSTLPRLYIALNLFLSRRYFQRVWIYQELFLGEDIQVCCEDQTVKLTVLWALYQTFWYWIKIRSTLMRDFIWYTSTVLEGVRFLLEAGLGIKRDTRTPLLEKLREMSKLQSEDIRDRVFGTLATTEWEGRKPIQPDYGKDRFDLVVEVVQAIIGPFDNSSEFQVGDTSLSTTIEVAKLLGLTDQPSSRLADEIEIRRSTPFKAPCLNPARMAQRLDLKPTQFMRFQIYFNNASWHIEPPPSIDLRRRHDARPLPTLQKWSRGTPWNVRHTDVLLPEEAQSQDVLLIPDANGSRPDKGVMPALIARRRGGQFELVGKALYAAGHNRILHLEAASCNVYLAHDDAIVLAYSCNWRDLEKGLCSTKDELLDRLVDNYFETRLCVEGTLSYATI